MAMSRVSLATALRRPGLAVGARMMAVTIYEFQHARERRKLLAPCQAPALAARCTCLNVAVVEVQLCGPNGRVLHLCRECARDWVAD